MQGGFGLIYWVLILGVFYFFLIAPEKKRQKQAQSMISSLKVGDNVMTRGGIIGRIESIDEDGIVVQTGPDGVRILVAKYAVASVLEPKAQESVEEPVEQEAAEFKENDDTQAKEIREE